MRDRLSIAQSQLLVQTCLCLTPLRVYGPGPDQVRKRRRGGGVQNEIGVQGPHRQLAGGVQVPCPGGGGRGEGGRGVWWAKPIKFSI